MIQAKAPQPFLIFGYYKKLVYSQSEETTEKKQKNPPAPTTETKETAGKETEKQDLINDLEGQTSEKRTSTVELQNAGMKMVDGQQNMLNAREIKNVDEITLLNQAAAMVDGVYHMMYEELKPGVRENAIVAWANKMLYEHGSDDVEAINAISGERCSPHPHNFTDRLLRPGDQAFFDIIQSYVGYRTCYYRTLNVCFATPAQQDAYKQCREWLDSAIELIKPGVSTDRVASVWPKAEEFGFPSEMDAFGLQFGHGLGVALHERPIISRLVSLENPMEIKTGMVFALETFCPAKDGMSAARIEEEVVVTDNGSKVITLFPAQDLPIANQY